MSNRNNDVFQVLPTKGNLAVLTAGNPVESLAVGQIGAFNALTGLSFGAATSPIPREFYFAVGVDRTGSGSLEDVRTSAGQVIQKSQLGAYTFKPHTAGQPMIVTVGGFKASCDTEYGIRVEFRNSRIHRIQGHNQFSKAYMVQTPCCEDCSNDCGTVDPNVLSKLFVDSINADIAGLLIAKYVARQAITIADHGTSADYVTGDEVSAADVAVITAFNLTAADADKVFVDFSLTSVPLKLKTFYQVNLGYHKLLETVLVVSLIAGFECSGVITTSQYPVYEEGSGTNIMQKEYHASGWTGSGPYKLSEVTGTAKDNIEYLADKATTYDQFVLQYGQISQSGWLEYNATLSTIIAVPEASTTTRNSVAALLDAIVAGGAFEALADDAAAASATSTVVEGVVTDITKDGIA